MKKNIYALMIAGVLTLSMCSCGGKIQETANEIDGQANPVKEQEAEEQKSSDEQEASEKKSEVEGKAEPENDTATEKESQNAQTDSLQDGEEGFSLENLKNHRFLFSSGAGAWGTTLVIHEDGSFSGEYSDSDMGDTGDGYPAGTVYQCDFTGQFTKPVMVNEYTYSMEIKELNYEREPGTEEIKEDALYKYSTPYGLEDAKNILIYLPGAPLSELPEDFRGWVGYYDLSGTDETSLPFYALNNESQQQGFSSYDLVEYWKTSISSVSERADELENSITKDPLDQSELNEKSMELYNLWDGTLNILWKDLKQTRDTDTMEALTNEERQWIELKEQEMAKAGAEFEGGSMQPMLESLKGAEMTKERVYELMEIFEKK
ncbi:MAG: DUF1311 domain-containing protein [Roseburia sp.]|nr:DUF1311 domain-containing protein [Roseburia sp.]